MLPKIIAVVSQSRGVGKTTIAVNLSVALARHGYSVLLVDSNTENPSVSKHLGMEGFGRGFSDVVRGTASFDDAVINYRHSPLDVVVDFPSRRPVKLDYKSVARLLLMGKSLVKYDFIVADGPSPLIDRVLPVPYDVIIVSTPKKLKLEEALGMRKRYKRLRVPNDLVINMVKGERVPLVKDEMQDVYGYYVVTVLPHDGKVNRSVAAGTPIYIADKAAGFSQRIEKLAKMYIVRKTGKAPKTKLRLFNDYAKS